MTTLIMLYIGGSQFLFVLRYVSNFNAKESSLWVCESCFFFPPTELSVIICGTKDVLQMVSENV